MAGPKAAGTVTGAGIGMPKATEWHPTVKALIVLVIVEIIAYGVIRRYTSHGG